MSLFLKESYRNPAKSSLVMDPCFTAKSGRPTSPKKSVSPVKTQCYLSPSSKSQQVLSIVCPGVWMALIYIDPIWKTCSSSAVMISKSAEEFGP